MGSLVKKLQKWDYEKRKEKPTKYPLALFLCVKMFSFSLLNVNATETKQINFIYLFLSPFGK